MKGFSNIGNTCYLNAGLQMIIQNKDLVKLVLKYSDTSPILNKIGMFFNEYYNKTDSTPLVPYDIKKIVEEKSKIFSGFNQQDSTEFIVYLLDIIDEEIKKVNPHGIKPIYGIDFNVRIKCKLRSCLKIYNKKETNNFLLLDINNNDPNLNSIDLNFIYKNFKSSNKLEDDNKYFCENCNDKRIASKRCFITEWPNYLCIWLKRFNQTGSKLSKNNQAIDIPLTWKYNNELQGAVIHSGSMSGGHYIYIGKQPNNKWYMYDDSSITEILDIHLKKILSTAYWLCYKKIS